MDDIINQLRFFESVGVTHLKFPDSGKPQGGVRARKADPASPETPVSLSLEGIRTHIGDCTRCKLHRTRKNIVFGVGNPKADLMFIGEAPGADEDEQGIPFVGRAGQLLTRIIETMFPLKREDVYIANILKCRPPGNRDPEMDEVEQCEGFLYEQIQTVGPKVIVALGRCAAQTLLRTTTPISQLRGQFFDYRGTLLIPTFHPSYLLRNPAKKREVFNDMVAVRSRLQEFGSLR